MSFIYPDVKRAKVESKKKKNGKSLKCKTVDIKTEENENDLDDEEFQHHEENLNGNLRNKSERKGTD